MNTIAGLFGPGMNAVTDLLSPGWVGSVIGLIGILAAVITFQLSRIGARPVFRIKVLRLLSLQAQALPNDVEIHFNGIPIQRLTRTQLIYWNSGTHLLRGTDVVAEDPLKFVFDGDGEILGLTVTKSVRAANKVHPFVTEGASNEVRISFDYLDPGDGAVIEVLHTFAKGFPRASGTIRGVPRGLIDLGRVASSPLDRLRTRSVDASFRSSAKGMILFGMGLAILAIFLPEPLVRLGTIGIGLLFLSVGLSAFPDSRKIPRRLRIDEPWS